MKKTITVLILVLTLLTFVIFIGISILFYRVRPITYKIQGITESDRIELYIKNKDELQSLKSIGDPARIRRIVSVIDSHNDWRYDEFTPPYTGSFGKPHPLWLIFYRDDQKQAVLTIGYSTDGTYSLQEVYGPGIYLGEQEFKEFLDLLKIDRKYALY